ncbi:thiamine-phosphate kinase [Leptolyngbya sp. FACHB-261]|uniref:thiamine-phosphate kinase n=1 Tax=Leptolyngbya sp. FACHB-261 TaxID=2692806 RepID=UPI001686FB1B|nr:thiamine-phosphate kinase [Leptolyngbya sp. FACHB-261]MBD2100160.1 thiamine-phosphate kinase [Leptolyngbya sp. FACHB-261]
MQTAQDLGEQGLLALVQQYCPPGVVGDDAALLPVQPGHELVVTTDVLVDEVHFSDTTTAAEDVGWRAAAANLSDLAAMGAQPLGLVIGVALPPTTPVAWLEGCYRGFKACLDRYGTVLVGGDLCRSSVRTLAVTALGQVKPERVIRRSGAKIGDAVLVSGVHGASRAGLELLLQPQFQPQFQSHWGQDLSPEQRQALQQAHQRPMPRLDVLPKLWAVSDRAAGMDSSDGLADALVQIARASGVGLQIDLEAIPKPRALEPQLALEWALYGGEDFELVLCLPPVAAEQLQAALGGEAAVIGQVVAGSGVRDLQGQELSQAQAFQHFA